MDFTLQEAFQAMATALAPAVRQNRRIVRVELDGYCEDDGSGFAGGGITADGSYVSLDVPQSEFMGALHVAAYKLQVASLGFCFLMGRDGAWSAYVNHDPAVSDRARAATLRLTEPDLGFVPAVLPPADPELIRERWAAVERHEKRPGATEEELSAAERELGFPLPPELRALLAITDGAETEWDEDDEPDSRATNPVEWCSIFPLSHIVSWHRDMKTFWHHQGVEIVPTTGELDEVAPVTWSPGWLQFADENDGVFPRAIDMSPGPGGTPGQIIFVPSEDNEGPIVEAPSLAAWLAGETYHHRGPLRAKVRLQPGQPLDLREQDPDLQGLTVYGPGRLTVAELAPLPRLRVLDVMSADVDLRGIADVALASLSLQECRADLSPLAHHRTLRSLQLADSLRLDQGTLTGLDAIATLPALESLTITAHDLDAVDLAALPELRSLTVVGPHPEIMRALVRFRPGLLDGMSRLSGRVS